MTTNSDPTRKDLLKTSYLKIEELKARLEQEKARQNEPIAIVGMSCRFPKGANDPDTFWQYLRDGIDCLSEIPKDRWDIDEFYDPDPAAPGKMYVRRLGLIDNVRGFDSPFFRITPREAAGMDPQQRIMLEAVWEALENAGQAPDKLAESNTGVFMGVTTCDYMMVSLTAKQEEANEEGQVHAATGISPSILSGRISYFLGLQGPCLSVDTACSSSVLAIHLACQSIRRGECSLAIAGAINLILAPIVTIATCKSRLLSPDGKCKVFDDSADGYARAEGCGVVVLKPLKDAEANGDRILGIIRSTACNQDGPSAGLTAPNGSAQRDLIRSAIDSAGLKPNDISFIETHGTGTRLGDPIEVNALGEVFGTDRPQNQPLILGAVKSSVGHMEPAAGMAGLIKVLLALQHNQIPPQLHFQNPNQFIPWDNLPFTIPTTLLPWPQINGRRIAGISCFGYSGTNTHMIVEQPQTVSTKQNLQERPWQLLTLSAMGEEPLRLLARRYANFLASNPQQSLGDICYTANNGRKHFNQRLAAVCSSTEMLRQQLEDFLAKGSGSEHITFGAASSPPPPIAFLVPEEAAVPNEYRAFYENSKAFCSALERLEQIAKPMMGRSLLEMLYPSSGNLEQAKKELGLPEYNQPAMFATGIALNELMVTCGIKPAFFVGHDMGELISACCAGVFSETEGLRLAIERGQWLKANNKSENNRVTSNTSNSLVADRLPYETPGIPVYSATLGREILADEACSPEYWRITGKTPSRWEGCLAELEAIGCKLILSLGHLPDDRPGFTKSSVSEDKITLSMVFDGRDDWQNILNNLAILYCKGYAIDWEAIDHPCKRTKVSLPTYPFQKQDYWVENATGFILVDKDFGIHPLLGERLRSPYSKGPVVFEQKLDTRCLEYLTDRQLYSTITISAGIYLEMAAAAGKLVFEKGIHHTERMKMLDPLTLIPRQSRLIQLLLIPDGTNSFLLEIWSADLKQNKPFHETWIIENTWKQHASGRITKGAKSQTPAIIESSVLSEWYTKCSQQIDPDFYYRKWTECGNAYGNSFRTLGATTRGNHAALSKINIPQNLKNDKRFSEYLLHPAILEAAVQLLQIAFTDQDKITPDSDNYVPVNIDHYSVHSEGIEDLLAHVQVRPQPDNHADELVGDVQFFEQSGKIIAELKGLRLKRSPRGPLQRQLSYSAVNKWIFQPGWNLQELPETGNNLKGEWLIWANSPMKGNDLARTLKSLGAKCTLSGPGSGFGFQPDGSFTCNYQSPEDFLELVKKTAPGNRLPNIVFLAVSDDKEIGNVEEIPPLASINCASLLHLLKAFAQSDNKQFGNFTIVTRGAQSVHSTDEIIDLPASALWGFGRVLASEIPELRCRNIDLDPSEPIEANIKTLIKELLVTDSPENQVAFRNHERLVARLLRWPSGKVIAKEPVVSLKDIKELKADATYLVTGGLGGLGLLLAEWLGEQGARRLILMGRSAPSSFAEKTIARLKAKGIEILISRADVSNRNQLQQMFQDMLPDKFPLRGVIHAAGLLDDGALVRQDFNRLEKVLAPKISGSWNLHQLTVNQKLDFFILFSSTAALMGNPGQGTYAAGNTFMDALAHKRRSMDLPALSINWGPWGSVGMAASLDARHIEQWAAIGIEPLEPIFGLACLETGLSQNNPQLAVLAIDELKLRRLLVGKPVPPFLSLLIPQRKNLSVENTSKIQLEAKEKLQKASPETRRAVLLELVRDVVRDGLGFDKSHSLPLDQNLASMGMDSLLSIHITNRLKNILGHPLPLSLTMEYPTIAAISDYLYQNLPQSEQSQEDNANNQEQEDHTKETSLPLDGIDPEEAQKILANIGHLSEEEMEALLAKLAPKTNQN